MKTIFGRLTKDPASVLFYASLLAGNLLFAGGKAAAALTLLLILTNGILRGSTGAFLENSSAVVSLTVRSLLSLGLFPFAWLTCRGLAGRAALPALAVLLCVGFLFSIVRKSPGNEATDKDKRWNVIAFLLVTVLTWFPFSRIGFPVDSNYAYRAYFSSDYLKHFSVVESLNQTGLPPANLYFQGEALHYYWLPYATPAFVAFFYRLHGQIHVCFFIHRQFPLRSSDAPSHSEDMRAARVGALFRRVDGLVSEPRGFLSLGGPGAFFMECVFPDGPRFQH